MTICSVCSPNRALVAVVIAVLTLGAVSAPIGAQPVKVVDLLETPTEVQLARVLGSTGTGAFGVPVASGFDVDNDGFQDVAMAAFTANPIGRGNNTGIVFLVLGDGTVEGTVDTAFASSRVLPIYGDQLGETAGSEIWMGDVTGDGIGDLIICRQNFTPQAGLEGAGAVSIVRGGAALATEAGMSGGVLDLRSPPAGIVVTTIVGSQFTGRLGIWARVADVTGEGVLDLVIGADQERVDGSTHAGSVWVVRGGAHLASGGTIDLGDFGDPGFSATGQVLRVLPPPVSGGTAPDAHGHFGATVQTGDLDGDDRAEIMAAAALDRAGASIGAIGSVGSHGSGGEPDGTLYILWSDVIPETWANGLTLQFGDNPNSETRINGGDGQANNARFGEEILPGLDYDGDGAADLFVGDIVGSTPNGGASGIGHVFFSAATLKGAEFDLDSPPSGLRSTTIYGLSPGSISADTAAEGDVDFDGYGDLIFSSPHANGLGRQESGVVHVFLGQPGGWPALVDLDALPPPSTMRIVEIIGARGNMPGDQGDTLAYSAAVGDLNGDGRVDLVTNEMLGNGSSQVDTGNLIALSGQLLGPHLFADGFETGDRAAWARMLTAISMPSWFAP